MKNRIYHLRKAILNISQEQFGKSINLSKANISNIENGRVNATDRVLDNIVNTYGVNKDWLLNGGPDEDIFIEKSKDEAFYAILQDMIEEQNVPFFQLIKDILTIYDKLDNEHKATLNTYVDMLLNQIASHKEQP